MAFEQFEGFSGGSGSVSADMPPLEAEVSEPDLTTVKVSLQRPFAIQDRKVSEITVPWATAGLVMDIDLGRIETPFEVVMALTHEDEAVLRALRYDDMDRVLAAVRKALPPRLRRHI